MGEGEQGGRTRGEGVGDGVIWCRGQVEKERSHPTNATRRNHCSTIFPFSFLQKSHNFNTNLFFLYFSPWNGTLTDAGDGDGGGEKEHVRNNKDILYYLFCIFLYIFV